MGSIASVELDSPKRLSAPEIPSPCILFANSNAISIEAKNWALWPYCNVSNAPDAISGSSVLLLISFVFTLFIKSKKEVKAPDALPSTIDSTAGIPTFFIPANPNSMILEVEAVNVANDLFTSGGITFILKDLASSIKATILSRLCNSAVILAAKNSAV